MIRAVAKYTGGGDTMPEVAAGEEEHEHGARSAKAKPGARRGRTRGRSLKGQGARAEWDEGGGSRSALQRVSGVFQTTPVSNDVEPFDVPPDLTAEVARTATPTPFILCLELGSDSAAPGSTTGWFDDSNPDHVAAREEVRLDVCGRKGGGGKCGRSAPPPPLHPPSRRWAWRFSTRC